ncbi:hypothetical protein M9H77_23078 [Catharanthus roseus]|uniref:Uncharacterized protein n=1 Tax=Catharanthus roseus TaxID=4058 RepID=A0ACC0AU06_CATRO|nr:hypothetical protein M9H77_23078 [Catharanthus roseus]
MSPEVLVASQGIGPWYVLISYSRNITLTSDNTYQPYVHIEHSMYTLYGLLQGSTISILMAALTAAANPIGGKGANAHCRSAFNPFTNYRVLLLSVSINLKQYLANLLNFAVYWATVRLPCLSC